MPPWYFSEPCIVFMHDKLKIVSVSLEYSKGKKMGWKHMIQDTTCSYEQLSPNGKSQQLAFPAKPLLLMGKHQELWCSVWIWWKLLSLVGKTLSPNTLNPAEELLWEPLGQWREMYETSKPWINPKQTKKSWQSTLVMPDLGKPTVFVAVSMLRCYSNPINTSNVLSCSWATTDTTWTLGFDVCSCSHPDEQGSTETQNGRGWKDLWGLPKSSPPTEESPTPSSSQPHFRYWLGPLSAISSTG